MIAYLDCFSGISGDMTLGALVDLGVPPEWLEQQIKSALPLNGFRLQVRTVHRSGIAAKKVDVVVDDEAERDYARIRQMIESGGLPDPVSDMSLRMFERMAAAEAKVHGCPIDAVHFHELGGVDAIVDIVGAALGFDYLGIESVWASPIALGSGTVCCAHGRLPVPAPATAALLEGVPAYGTDSGCELVTPTGATIATTLAEGYGVLPDMTVGKAGYGAGQRELKDQPNLLRIITGQLKAAAGDTMEIVETCIDDMNPEVFGYLAERLFADGAADVYMIPVYMKKGRPGTLLQVLCSRARRSAVCERVLSETTAIGIRHYTVQRQVLERCAVTIETPLGPVAAKKVWTPDGGTRIAPEYEACRKIAAERNLPIRSVYETALRHLDTVDTHGGGPC